MMSASEYQHAYYMAHREQKLAERKTYALTHQEEISARKAAYYAANRAKKVAYFKAYNVARRSLDLNFRLAHNLRTRISRAIIKGQKSGSAIRDLGCTIPEFRVHIERLFKDGMSWENYGQWHLDHIRPLRSFDLTNREKFLQAAHYTNYQPLWALENMIKNGKLETSVSGGVAW